MLILLAVPAARAEREAVEGELIVRWRATPSVVRVKLPELPRAREITLQPRQRIDDLTQVLRVPADKRDAALAALQQRPDVEYAELNYVRRIFATPNDEHYPVQWYLTSSKVNSAWEVTVGKSDTIVAVVDTGIRAGHPDLKGRLVPGYDFISNVENAADGDGRDDDPHDDGENSPASSALHGTHVAGIIGAVANNNEGIAGVNWSCKVLPVRVLGVTGGKGTDADISAGIRWAAGLKIDGVEKINPNKANVINLSFGSPGYGKTLSNAVIAAIGEGVVVVAAAGNDGVDAEDTFPAAVGGVITVGATDYDKSLAPYSNYGNIVDIVAPGGNLAVRLPFSHQDREWNAGILSTMYDSLTSEYTYHLTEGTSQAAPIISGVISLMFAIDPKTDQQSAAEALIETADTSARCDQGCGAGLVDARAALQYVSDSSGKAPEDEAKITYIIGNGCAIDQPCSPVASLILLLIFLARRRRQ